MKHLVPLLLLSACGTVALPTRNVTASGPADGLRAVRSRTILADALPKYEDRIACLGPWGKERAFAVALVNGNSWARRKDEVLIASTASGAIIQSLSYPTEFRGHFLHSTMLVELGSPGPASPRKLAVLSSEWTLGNPPICILRVFDGLSSAPTWSTSITVAPSSLPTCFTALPDLDHDGTPELGVGVTKNGADNHGSTSVFGSIQVRSGSDGHLLWSAEGVSGASLGSDLAPASDVDGDGTQDFAVVVVHRASDEVGASSLDPLPYVDILSGANGQRIRTLTLQGERLGFGTPRPYLLRGGSDVNHDGVVDIAMRSPLDDQSLLVMSITDGHPVARITQKLEEGQEMDFWFPSDFELIPDLDGDDWPDLLIGHDDARWNGMNSVGAIYVQSSRTNEPLLIVRGDHADQFMGTRVVWLGDTDDDGRPEFGSVCGKGITIWSIERVPASPAKGAGGK